MLLEANGISLVTSLRKKANGQYPDRIPGPGGHMRDCTEERFPAYSPDINSPIEKCWSELDRRVKSRSSEIHSWKEMKSVVKEAWSSLEFEATEKWCGINHLVEKLPMILDEVILQKGYDTKYMKN